VDLCGWGGVHTPIPCGRLVNQNLAWGISRGEPPWLENLSGAFSQLIDLEVLTALILHFRGFNT
jgi:hypothetical protein